MAKTHRGAFTRPYLLQGSSTLFVGLWVDDSDPDHVVLRSKSGATSAATIGTSMLDASSTIQASSWRAD
jgi:hypothetical protein